MVNSANTAEVTEEFVGMVAEALRLQGQFRKNRDLSTLAEFALAESPLVQNCFLVGESNTLEAHGYGVQAILHWGVDKLSPGGKHSFTARQWRLYNTLFYPYLAEEGLTFQELAEKMALGEGAVFKARDQALEIVAARLHKELLNPQELDERKKYVTEYRYKALEPEEKSTLHLAAIFRHPIPTHVLQQLARENGVADPSKAIHRLTGNWLKQVRNV